MVFSGIFYNYIVNKGKARVKKWVEIYNYIVNKEKMYVKNERKSTTIPEIKKNRYIKGFTRLVIGYSTFSGCLSGL